MASPPSPYERPLTPPTTISTGTPETEPQRAQFRVFGPQSSPPFAHARLTTTTTSTQPYPASGGLPPSKQNTCRTMFGKTEPHRSVLCGEPNPSAPPFVRARLTATTTTPTPPYPTRVLPHRNEAPPPARRSSKPSPTAWFRAGNPNSPLPLHALGQPPPPPLLYNTCSIRSSPSICGPIPRALFVKTETRSSFFAGEDKTTSPLHAPSANYHNHLHPIKPHSMGPSSIKLQPSLYVAL
jgi:hypothetical protein